MKQHERTISGRVYRCHKMPAADAVYLKLRLINVLGETLGSLLSSFGDGTDMDDMTELGAMLGKALSGIDPKEALNLIKEVCERAYVEGEKLVFNKAFADTAMTDIYKVFGFVLEVNYSDFFGEKGVLSFLEEKTQGLGLGQKK